MQRLAREFTPRAAEILRAIADDPSEGRRNRIVAIGLLHDRAWGERALTLMMERRRARRRRQPPLVGARLFPSRRIGTRRDTGR
jgi:hypothetical protein